MTNVSVQRTIDWSAAIWSAIIAGVVFMMLEMIMVPLFGGDSPWAPPRMIAAIGMGSDVLPPPATFDLTVMMVAIVIHLILAVVYAVILAFVINRQQMGMAILSCAIFGLALYFINFYGFTAVFPWFAMARNLISIFAYLLFVLVLAWSYKGLQARKAMAT